MSNQVLEANYTATRLIRTTDTLDNDIVSIDSCFTGPQPMLFAGTRYSKPRRRIPGPAYPWDYVQLGKEYSRRLIQSFSRSVGYVWYTTIAWSNKDDSSVDIY